PGSELVGPRLDRVLPTAGDVDRESARPPHAAEVGVHAVQRALAGPAIRRAIAHDRAEDLVTVTEYVGGDVDDVADAPLDWISAPVDAGGRELDDDPVRRLVAPGAAVRGADRGRRSRGLDAHE